jgi:hypothetical protein
VFSLLLFLFLFLFFLLLQQVSEGGKRGERRSIG